MERRTLIRLLVVLGIGIPLLVEGFTLLGLLEAQLLGGGGDATPTPSVEGVEVGDELLPETAPEETLTTASLGDDGRTLTLSVRVDNAGNGSYELRLTDVRTRDNETIAGNASTGDLAPGETGFASGQWTLPAGDTPASVTVVALVDRNGETERIERSITLAPL